MPRLAAFGIDVLYKFTFFLFTYLLVWAPMEKQKGTENQNWCEHFSGLRTGLIDVPIFSLEGKN